jgi:hypothetical protein
LVSNTIEPSMPISWTATASFSARPALVATLVLLVGCAPVTARPPVPYGVGSIDGVVEASPLPVPAYPHTDVRVLAWSAWTAARDRDHSAQPMLERLVTERIDDDPWSVPVHFGLDALIQLRARLGPDLLSRIAERRPVEGLILLSYLEDGTGDSVLAATLRRQRGYEWFAAANLLLRPKPPGFAASLLDGLRLQARITVSSTGTAGFGSGSGGSSHSDRFPWQLPGMPPWPSYDLTPDPDDIALGNGPTPVYYRRRVSEAGHGALVGSPSIGGPTARDRLRYVAALIGRAPALHDDEHQAVRRRRGLRVNAVAARLRRDIERRHRLLVRDLVAGGFVTPTEARRLSVHVDVIVHHVDD